MFTFLILLYLIQNADSTVSESSLLNGSAEGSDAVKSGYPKVRVLIITGGQSNLNSHPNLLMSAQCVLPMWPYEHNIT